VADAGGFPNLDVVRRSVNALYRTLSSRTVRSFTESLSPSYATLAMGDDPVIGVQYVAAAVVRHLRLPEARMIVGFRDMPSAAQVELADGPEYFIEMQNRYKRDHGDIAGVLAHEVTHVFLHRAGLSFPELEHNEILTDVTATYLGAGWLTMNAHRVSDHHRESLGYLTPQEFGYVLGHRAIAFREDPMPWFNSPAARKAYEIGRTRALADHRRAPLATADPLAARRYRKDRHTAAGLAADPAVRAVSLAYDDYRFDGPAPLRVTFACPTCFQRIRLPARGRVTARCTVCASSLTCDT
jgi:hypothetical protein